MNGYVLSVNADQMFQTKSRKHEFMGTWEQGHTFMGRKGTNGNFRGGGGQFWRTRNITLFYIFGELENQGKRESHLEGLKGKIK